MSLAKKALFCGLLLASPLLRAADDAVSRAMHDELQRSMQKLKLQQFDKPYFISYLIVDNELKEVAATLGSVLSSVENSTRVLLVTVRVGDYGLDSGNFVSTPTTPEGMANLVMAGAIQLPLDDNYNELRRKIWLTTDRAYKKALEDFSASPRRHQRYPQPGRAGNAVSRLRPPFRRLDWNSRDAGRRGAGALGACFAA